MTTIPDDRWLDAVPLKGVGPEHLRDKLILPAHLSSSAFGLVGNVTAIDPDDAASAGSTGLIADAGHQHAFTSGAASSLAKTASNTEGSSSSHARADHGHATDALPWGIIAREKLTTDSSGITATGATDLNVSADALVTRLYEATVLTTWTVTVATGRWIFYLYDDGNQVARFGDTKNVAINDSDVLHSTVLWEPTTGTHSLELRVGEAAGASTLVLNAATTDPRWLWVKDIGPR